MLTPPFEDDLSHASKEQKVHLCCSEQYASLAVYLATNEYYLTSQVITPTMEQ